MSSRTYGHRTTRVIRVAFCITWLIVGFDSSVHAEARLEAHAENEALRNEIETLTEQGDAHRARILELERRPAEASGPNRPSPPRKHSGRGAFRVQTFV